MVINQGRTEMCVFTNFLRLGDVVDLVCHVVGWLSFDRSSTAKFQMNEFRVASKRHSVGSPRPGCLVCGIKVINLVTLKKRTELEDEREE